MRDNELMQRVLSESPCSIRKLAEEAGVNETLLRKIRDGERNLTDDTRAAVADALRRWAHRCGNLADLIDSNPEG